MKFIPNKEVPISENLQKLKLKLPDGRDVGEVKIVLPGHDEKFQSKLVTMSKIGQKTEKPISWTLKSESPAEITKPKIKTVTRIINNSITSEGDSKEIDKSNSPKMTVQIFNKSHDIFGSSIQDNKTILTNIKKNSCVDECESNKQKRIVQRSDSDMLRTFIMENPGMIVDKQNGQSKVITFKKLSGSKKVIMMQKDHQIMKPISENPISLKSATQNSLSNLHITKSLEKISFKSSINGSFIRKRDSSSLEHLNSQKSKQARVEINLENEHLENHNGELIDSEQNSLKSIDSSKEISNSTSRKNITVFVPNVAADEKKKKLNSNTQEFIQADEDNIICVSDNEIVSKNTDFGENFIHKKSEPTKKNNLNINKTPNDNNVKSQDFLDKFDILKKAVLSVQDANLRAEALRALKDCGIKVKKSIPINRPAATKIINESASQTEVFSLLKNEEFIQITEDTDDLIKIKQSRKLMKQPINTLNIKNQNSKFYSELNQNKFRTDLDNVLERVFPGNKGIMDVKEAFVQKKIACAKIILKQLKMDFMAAKNHDSDGLLGIHKAIMNDDVQEVQKHVLMLKAAQQTIDVGTADDNKVMFISI